MTTTRMAPGTDGGYTHCERCGEKLNPTRAVWLDLNQWTLRYRVEPWPAGESQGAFPFGPACAARILKAGGEMKRPRRRA